jgi:hypothetical protein
MGEIFENEEDPRPGIVQLRRQFARRVERIDVDDDIAAEKDSEHDGRIGHDVRHHDGDAVAFLQAEALEADGDLFGLVDKFAIGQANAETLDSGAIGVDGGCVADDVDDGFVRGFIDFLWNAFF